MRFRHRRDDLAANLVRAVLCATRRQSTGWVERPLCLCYHQPTKDYIQRRTEEGRTKREIIRRLKRYVAREVYKALTQTSQQKLARAA